MDEKKKSNANVLLLWMEKQQVKLLQYVFVPEESEKSTLKKKKNEKKH